MAVTDIKSAASILRTEDTTFNTSDLQGVFKGRRVTLGQKDTRDDDWTSGFQQERQDAWDSEPDPSKRKAQSRTELRKTEQRAKSRLADSLSDFTDDAEFQGYQTILRRMMRDRDYSSLREESEHLFPDVALRHGAVSAAARLMKDNTGSDSQLQEELERYTKELEEAHGPAIKAGYNITRRADAVASGHADIRQQLRDFYRDAVFGERNPAEAYEFILDRFPGEIPAAKAS
jgi:hypothetical protein